jgi:hypothetical protein
MTEPARTSLHDALGSDLNVLDQLTADEAAELAGLIRAARAAQQAALDDSVEIALGHLPRVVRGTARRVLFG